MSNNNLQSLLEFKENSQSLESRIEEIRHDHKNSLTTIGEALDNSVGWGKCKNIKINLYENTFCIADDGVGFESIERLKKALLLGKKNNQVLDGNKDILKGKFGLGLPKGSIIVGNKVIIITKIEIKYFTAIANWDIMKSENCFTPVIRDSTSEEIHEYNSYFGNGSLIKYENLLNESILNAENIYDYIKCLYQSVKGESLPNIIIMKNNNVHDFGLDNIENPINQYLDITFSKQDPLFVKTGNLLKHKDGHYSVNFSNDSINKSDILFNINIIYNALSPKFYKKESGFINKKMDDLIGFKIYRNGRDVTTGKAMRFSCIDPDKKMYRDKGVRIKLVFEDNMKNTNIFDNDFKVSSLKCIDESCYYHFSKSLKDCLEQIGHYAEDNFENRKKEEKLESEKHLLEMFSNIIANYKVLDLEYVIKSLNIIDILKDERKYYPVISNSNINYEDDTDIVPFTFDKRNGFYKHFCEYEYLKLTYRLKIRKKMIQEPETINSIINHDFQFNNENINQNEHIGENNNNILDNITNENIINNSSSLETPNNEQNVLENHEHNFVENNDSNVVENNDSNVVENLEHNVVETHDSNVVENLEHNVVEKHDSNVVENHVSDVVENNTNLETFPKNKALEITFTDKLTYILNLNINVIQEKIKSKNQELINKLYDILK